jgi:hypothetical protein
MLVSSSANRNLRYVKTKKLAFLAVIVALTTPAIAGKPHKGGGKQPPQQQPAPAPSGPQPASVRISSTGR